MLLYRLTRCIYANDLSGGGARLYGGRWNSEGKPVIYLASNRALAVLEALVHLPPVDIPYEYCMVTIEVPDDFSSVDEKTLPQNWQDPSDQDALKLIGNIFLFERKHLMLKVPSAIVSEEFNFMVNSLHSLAAKIKVKDVQPFNFDHRLIPSKPAPLVGGKA